MNLTPWLLLGARVLLAGVFAFAGWAKLADRAGTRRAIADFGIPEALAVPMAWLLPLAEVLVAAALLPSATARWAAMAALALLLMFTAGMAGNLAAGHPADCHCFGRFSRAPVTWRTFARNLLLAGAAWAVIRGGFGAGPAPIEPLAPGDWLALPAVLAVLAWQAVRLRVTVAGKQG